MGDFDPANYQTEFLFAPARDGKRIPVSFVYRKGFVRNGTAPLLQYAYGAYGLSMDPSFSSARLSLLDRGFVYAIAHVRGGQELGRAWYDDGRLLNKKNSFTDFIDVTHDLVARGYGAKGQDLCDGRQRGRALDGRGRQHESARTTAASSPKCRSSTSSRPCWTRAFRSPPMNTMSGATRTIGNSTITCCPIRPTTTFARRRYPAMLVTTGLWDSQVQYYEPAKWVAKLRTLKTDDNPLLLHVDMEAGHGGKSGRFQRYRETAMEYAFVLASGSESSE